MATRLEEAAVAELQGDRLSSSSSSPMRTSAAHSPRREKRTEEGEEREEAGSDEDCDEEEEDAHSAESPAVVSEPSSFSAHLSGDSEVSSRGDREEEDASSSDTPSPISPPSSPRSAFARPSASGGCAGHSSSFSSSFSRESLDSDRRDRRVTSDPEAKAETDEEEEETEGEEGHTDEEEEEVRAGGGAGAQGEDEARETGVVGRPEDGGAAEPLKAAPSVLIRSAPSGALPLITYRGKNPATQKLLEERLGSLSHSTSSVFSSPTKAQDPRIVYLSRRRSHPDPRPGEKDDDASSESARSSSVSAASSAATSASSLARRESEGGGGHDRNLSWALRPFEDFASYFFRQAVAPEKPELSGGPPLLKPPSSADALAGPDAAFTRAAGRDAREERSRSYTDPSDEGTSSPGSDLFSSSGEDEAYALSPPASSRAIPHSLQKSVTADGEFTLPRAASSRRVASYTHLPSWRAERRGPLARASGELRAADKGGEPPDDGKHSHGAADLRAADEAAGRRGGRRGVASGRGEGEREDGEGRKERGQSSMLWPARDIAGRSAEPGPSPRAVCLAGVSSLASPRAPIFLPDASATSASHAAAVRLPSSAHRRVPLPQHPLRFGSSHALFHVGSAPPGGAAARAAGRLSCKMKRSATMLLAAKWRRRAQAAAVASERAREASARLPLSEAERRKEEKPRKSTGRDACAADDPPSAAAEADEARRRKKKKEKQKRDKSEGPWLTREDLALRNSALVTRVAAVAAAQAAQEAAEKSVRAALVEAALKFRMSRVTLSDWMKTQGLQQQRIWDVIFPATHNSASWKLAEVTSKQPMLLSMIKNWVACQHVNITEQLSRGIRWLDLRVCKIVDETEEVDSSSSSSSSLSASSCSASAATRSSRTADKAGKRDHNVKRSLSSLRASSLFCEDAAPSARSDPERDASAQREREPRASEEATPRQSRKTRRDDARPSKSSDSFAGVAGGRTTPYCAHGGVCTVPLISVLCEIREFLEAHPSEIVLVSTVADHGVCQGAFCDTRSLNSSEVDFYVGRILAPFLGAELEPDTTLETLLKRQQRVLYFWNHEERCLPPFDLCPVCLHSFAGASPSAPAAGAFLGRRVEGVGGLAQARREREREGRYRCTCERGRLEAWLDKAQRFFSSDLPPSGGPKDARASCKTHAGKQDAHVSRAASRQESPPRLSPHSEPALDERLHVPSSSPLGRVSSLSPAPAAEFLSPSVVHSVERHPSARSHVSSSSTRSYPRSPFKTGKTKLLKSWSKTRAAKPEILISHLDAWLQERKEEATRLGEESGRFGNRPFVFQMLCGEVTAPDSLGLNVVLYWTKEAQSALRRLPHGIKTNAKATNRLLLRLLAEQHLRTREQREARLHRLNKAVRRAKRRRERRRRDREVAEGREKGDEPDASGRDAAAERQEAAEDEEERRALLRQLEEEDGVGEVKGLHVLNAISHDFVNKQLTQFIVLLNLEKVDVRRALTPISQTSLSSPSFSSRRDTRPLQTALSPSASEPRASPAPDAVADRTRDGRRDELDDDGTWTEERRESAAARLSAWAEKRADDVDEERGRPRPEPYVSFEKEKVVVTADWGGEA
ncbi:hypothetical protein BESB_033160 [Besnoitia besnoiti]|uniref:Uncharacterized protein n=1 Tax=Besnoitia besnoiti TaxID=94643 RepID=A0A2A9M5W5_BESBE|nr:uncharacterized protein BESB_033160 [Besnoitia besnoiti]PFH31043.1 hypothetical protein BESB_033160 [Besnoitia besnoiti]